MSYDTISQLGDFYISCCIHGSRKGISAMPRATSKRATHACAILKPNQMSNSHRWRERHSQCCCRKATMQQSPDYPAGIIPLATLKDGWELMVLHLKMCLSTPRMFKNFFHQRTLVGYQTQLNEMVKKWSAQFYEYFLKNNIYTLILHRLELRWVLEDRGV